MIVLILLSGLVAIGWLLERQERARAARRPTPRPVAPGLARRAPERARNAPRRILRTPRPVERQTRQVAPERAPVDVLPTPRPVAPGTRQTAPVEQPADSHRAHLVDQFMRQHKMPRALAEVMVDAHLDRYGPGRQEAPGHAMVRQVSAAINAADPRDWID